MCIDKAEPKKLPVWVKMLNVPMEAWSVKRISALASIIEKPIIMDKVTIKMCVTGVGRIGFTRVLVEINAEKGIKDKIKIITKNKNVIDVDKIKENGNGFKEVQNRRYGREGFVINRRTEAQNGQKGKMCNEGRFGNSEEMKRYYRDKKELIDAAKEMEENEDVLDENDDVENTVLRNEVKGGREEFPVLGILFYKTAWSIVGKEVSQDVREFFNTRKLLGEVNATLISLVPKIPIHGKVLDFRTIACCNVMYKCISKIMTNRLKGVLVKYCESVRIMKKSLDKFSNYSGILPNMQRSTIFFGGLSNAEQQSILNIIPFSVGKRHASVFLLPKHVIYEIDKILKGFLWCQGDLTKRKAKVSWNAVCKPKEQDGLGLKNLCMWNEVLLTKHLWNVATKKDTLWVKWIIMENILSLRDKNKEHIWWKIGNGRSVNMWHDRWCSVSPLRDFIEATDIYDARLSNNCTVSEVIQEGRLICGAAVYYIWQERNNRLFKNEKREIKTVFNIDREALGMKLMGLKVKESRTTREVEERWNVKMKEDSKKVFVVSGDVGI
nr:hypothetical protein [Tanacetum cinerariifolium]